MSKSVLTFVNGLELEIREDQVLVPIMKEHSDGKAITHTGKPYQVWSHIHDGLIPSLTEFLAGCAYFRLADDNHKVFNPSTIVKIENI